jgi:hypothetical protein
MSSTRVTCPAHNSKATLTPEASEAKRALRLGSNCAWAATALGQQKNGKKGKKLTIVFLALFVFFCSPFVLLLTHVRRDGNYFSSR